MQNLNDYRKTRYTLALETLLLLDDPHAERWSHTRVAEALNDAILEFGLKTQMIKEKFTVQLLEDVWLYHVKAQIIADGSYRDYAWPLRVGFDGTSEPAMFPLSKYEIDMRGVSMSTFSRGWSIDEIGHGYIATFPPSSDGEDLPSTENNIQITYVAYPTYMSASGSYPDSKIPAFYHQGFIYGAAYRLLEESGDPEDIKRTIELEAEFNEWIYRAVSEEFRGFTRYDDMRPG